MSKVDIIKNKAYMVLADLAFCFEDGNLVVYNLKNIQQRAVFWLRNDGRFLLSKSDMSECNTYKSIALVERNREFLRGGILNG